MKLGNSRISLAGASFVSRPSCPYDHPDAPLMYAIGFALEAGERLDSFMNGVFPPYPDNSLGGGDPGWLWYHDLDEAGQDVIVVEIDNFAAPPDGMWNEYRPSKVKYEVRAALNNLLFHKPENFQEVDRIIKKFDLSYVDILPGLKPIPPWSGNFPEMEIVNEL